MSLRFQCPALHLLHKTLQQQFSQKVVGNHRGSISHREKIDDGKSQHELSMFFWSPS